MAKLPAKNPASTVSAAPLDSATAARQRRNLLTPPIKGSTSKAKVIPPTTGENNLTNVETVGDKLKVYSLRNLLQAKRTFKVREPSNLADVLEPWFAKNVEKPGQKLGPITDIWMALVPPEIQDQCRIAGLNRSTLLIQVSNAPARAHLEGLLRQGLLKQLQIQSKGTVYRIKTSIAGGIVT